MIRNLQELYQYRALLWALTLRELKARYRASVLGFFWTFLNPTLNMAVYVLVFSYIMDNKVPKYAYSVFNGLLPWIFFTTSVMGGTSSISDRRDLLTKVRFPAQVLPATVVMTNLLNFALSLPLLLALGLVYQHYPTWHVIFAIPLIALQAFFTLAVTYLLSALNVAFRDLQHIVANVLQMAFFLTPVLWSLNQTPEQWRHIIPYANPLAALVLGWKSIFYEQSVPALKPLVGVALVSLVMMLVSTAVFERRREEFAELI